MTPATLLTLCGMPRYYMLCWAEFAWAVPYVTRRRPVGVFKLYAPRWFRARKLP